MAKKPSKPTDEFKDVEVGSNLKARVFRDGKVTFGFMLENGDKTNPKRIEVEATMTFKDARDWCERITGMVNQFDGRY